MSLREAPLKGKWRLNMSQPRPGNQYVFEQKSLSIDGGSSKLVVQAVVARRRWDTEGNIENVQTQRANS